MHGPGRADLNSGRVLSVSMKAPLLRPGIRTFALHNFVVSNKAANARANSFGFFPVDFATTHTSIGSAATNGKRIANGKQRLRRSRFVLSFKLEGLRRSLQPQLD